mmetsp:Transcript_39824/g.38377  ORF Transcript_39824/g.38377 Transcript_39824/m.38377 type:complete len:200 (+) Transcript_39824:1155-1754(+)
MLLIKGYPSRSSLINHIRVKNIHVLEQYPALLELFKLIEEEESPFVISKKGQGLFEKIFKENEELRIYEPFIKKNLSVRILQKCKSFFKNITFDSLKKILVFYKSFQEIELLLYECNREELIRTVMDHSTQTISFDQEQEMASNLQKFGHSLKKSFALVREAGREGGERERIFMKVKEKLEYEMKDVESRRNRMAEMKD